MFLHYHEMVTLIPSVWIQVECFPIGFYPKRSNFFGGPVGNGRAARPTIEPQNERFRPGLATRRGLDQPVEKGPARLLVHGNVARELREVDIGWLARELEDSIPLLLLIER